MRDTAVEIDILRTVPDLAWRQPLSSGAALNLCRVLLISVLLLFSVSCVSHLPPPAGEKIYRDLIYASAQGLDLRMDLYVPQTKKPAPVVVWIFGGSWKFGSRKIHLVVRDLTRSGIAVASMQYRVSRLAKYPAQLDDCEDAVAWLRANGGEYGIDPKRIGVSGESAGGHLAAMVGLTEGAPRISAVFAMYPPTDLVSLGKRYHRLGKMSAIDQLLGGPLEKKMALAREGSPINYVSSSAPPFLIMHGAKDIFVPIQQSRDLQQRLEKAGVEAKLVVAPEMGHWFALNEERFATLVRFLRKHFHMDSPGEPLSVPQ